MAEITQIELNGTSYNLADTIARNYAYSKTESQTSNTVLAAPNGSAGAATFRALDAADIPGLAASKITSGTIALAQGGTATNNSSIAINKVFAGPSSGSAGNASFRSLAAADIPSLAASKITSGTLALAQGGTNTDNSSVAINKVFAGPSSGSTGSASFRSLVANDIPGLSANKITSGTLALDRGGTNTDNSSVAINRVFASPSSGSAGNASFRSLVAADIPSLAASKITSGTFDQARIPATIEHDTAISGMFNINDATLIATGSPSTNTTGTATKYLRWRDSESNVLGYARIAIEDGSEATGTGNSTVQTENSALSIVAYRPAGLQSGDSATTHGVTLKISNRGTRYVSFSDAAAWRTGLGIGFVTSDTQLTGTNAITASSGYTLTNVVLRQVMEKVVQLNFTFKGDETSSSSVKIGQIPSAASAYYPQNTAYGCAYADGFYGVYVNSNGAVYARKVSTSALNASITYIVN